MQRVRITGFENCECPHDFSKRQVYSEYMPSIWMVGTGQKQKQSLSEPRISPLNDLHMYNVAARFLV